MLTLPRPQALHFVSGASAISDLRGLLRMSVPLGVSIPELSAPGLVVLLAAARRPLVRVFVDSGAFSEVDRAGRIVAPISLKAWRKRVAVMLRIARAFGARAWIVVPDCVGHQLETLARLRAFASQMRLARDLGARVIVPIQRGDMSPARFDAECAEILGFEDYSRGIPGNKVAMPAAELETFLRARRPGSVHLLGIGPRNPRFQALADVLRRLAPGAEVTCDSNSFSAVTGRTNGEGGSPRTLTSWQDHLEGRESDVASPPAAEPSENARELAVMMTFGPASVWWRFVEQHGGLIGVRLEAPALQQGLFDQVVEGQLPGRGTVPP